MPNSTVPRLFYFVLMPFDSQFDDIYELGIKQACELGGAYCERVDEQVFHQSFLPLSTSTSGSLLEPIYYPTIFKSG